MFRPSSGPNVAVSLRRPPDLCKALVTMRSGHEVTRGVARVVPGGRVRARSAFVVLTVLVAALATLVAVVSPANADEIGDKQAQAAQIAKQLDGLQRKQMELEQSFNEANLKLDQANEDIAAAQTRVDQVSHEVDQHK